jgi:hypothetical protein
VQGFVSAPQPKLKCKVILDECLHHLFFRSHDAELDRQPPRAVRTLRSLSFAAMALWLVMPARSISSMIGSTLAANCLAFALTAATPRFAALASWGLPSRTPRALAACRAALVCGNKR